MPSNCTNMSLSSIQLCARQNESFKISALLCAPESLAMERVHLFSYTVDGKIRRRGWGLPPPHHITTKTKKTAVANTPHPRGCLSWLSRGTAFRFLHSAPQRDFRENSETHNLSPFITTYQCSERAMQTSSTAIQRSSNRPVIFRQMLLAHDSSYTVGIRYRFWRAYCQHRTH